MTIRRAQEGPIQRAQRAMRDVFPGSLGGRTPVADPFAPAVVPTAANPVGVQRDKPSAGGGGAGGVYVARITGSGTVSTSAFASYITPNAPSSNGDSAYALATTADNSLMYVGSGGPSLWLAQIRYAADFDSFLSSTDFVRFWMRTPGRSATAVVSTRETLAQRSVFLLLANGDEISVQAGTDNSGNSASHSVSFTLIMLCLGPSPLYLSGSFDFDAF